MRYKAGLKCPTGRWFPFSGGMTQVLIAPVCPSFGPSQPLASNPVSVRPAAMRRRPTSGARRGANRADAARAGVPVRFGGFRRASAARCRRPLAAGSGHCGVGTRSPAATAHRRSSHARGRAPTDVICVVRRSVMDWKQSNFVEDVSASPSRASAIGPRRKTSSC